MVSCVSSWFLFLISDDSRVGDYGKPVKNLESQNAKKKMTLRPEPRTFKHIFFSICITGALHLRTFCN